MFTKNNRMLFGAFLIIIGAYILINSNVTTVGSLPWLTLGAALLLLYYNKRKTFALVSGTFIFELALYPTLRNLGLSAVSLPLILFFFIPGTIFMALFLTKKAQGLLIPASLLLWTGFGLAFTAFFEIRRSWQIIAICVGIAFITVYLLGNLKNAGNYFFLGLLISVFGVYSFVSPVLSIGKIGWLTVIILCVMLFVKSRKNRNTDGDDV